MASVNKVLLIGNLGRDPELKKTPNGKSVCTISIATTKKRKDQSGQLLEKTEWHSVVLWNKLAETVHRFLKKGSSVFIEGELSTRSWESPDGQKHYKTEVVANNMQFVGGGNNSKQSNHQEQNNYKSQYADVTPDLTATDTLIEDDLPF